MSGCRYRRAIKQGLNKLAKNRSAVHPILADIIADYSHKSEVRPGDYLMCHEYHFFIITELLSQHWCRGFFCPPRLEFASTMHGIGTFYRPDIRNRSHSFRKKLFAPFSGPHVKCRERIFTLSRKFNSHEQMPHPPLVFS